MASIAEDFEKQPEETTEATKPVEPTKVGNIRGIQGDTGDEEWLDHGIIDVPVKDLPAPEGVSSSADFNHHISWENAQKASEKLPGIQEDLKNGKTADDLFKEDQENGLGSMEGKEAVYNLYYGNDPVSLEKVDGEYTILSGRHRIFAADKMGLETIPAWVREKKN